MNSGGPARAIHLSRASQRRDRSATSPPISQNGNGKDQSADAQQDDGHGLQRVLAGQGPCFGESAPGAGGAG